MCSVKRIGCLATLAGLLYAASLQAQYYAARGYNPYNGQGGASHSYNNRYTGRSGSGQTSYNRYTNSYSHSAQGSNPGCGGHATNTALSGSSASPVPALSWPDSQIHTPQTRQ